MAYSRAKLNRRLSRDYRGASMKKLITVALVGFCLSIAAHAQAKKEPTAQQALMGTCNKEAGEKSLKGDERKKFMSTCLADGRKRQNEKMKACAAENKGKKGNE